MQKRRQSPLDFIKNPDLIASMYSDIESRKLTVVIKNEQEDGTATKASHVFHGLPSGFCNKCETGIGATTAEIISGRNSIIVEPVKHTAISKQEKHDGYYYGSKPGSMIKKKMMADLVKYLQHPCSPKKIFCVADRLEEVVKTISNPEFFHLPFHLFVDEIDSVQLDTVFRSVMNIVMEIYKDFPPERRTAVTATFLDFSDPELSSEPLLEIRYAITTPRKIHFVRTNNLVMETASKILQNLRLHPKEKIVVAINNTKTIFQIIELLKTENTGLQESDIKILASEGKKEYLGSYYGTVKNGILPGKLIFITSAYFTGYDFEESYHSIIPGSLNHEAFCISLRKYIQAAGRSRKGLLSETFILERKKNRKPYCANKKSLEEDAKAQLDLLFQVNQILRNTTTLKDQVLKIQRDVINRFPFGTAPLLFENSEGTFRISYNNIDALLEKSQVQNELYLDDNRMLEEMRELGWIVTTEDTNHSEDVKIKTLEPKLDLRKKIIAANLWEAAEHGHRVEINYAKQSKIESRIFKVYNEYWQQVDTDFLVKSILRTFKDRKGKTSTNLPGLAKQLKSLERGLWYATLDPFNPLKVEIETNLREGMIYERSHLEEVITGAFNSVGLITDDWLKFLRTNFNVTDVRDKPSVLKILSRRIPTRVVRISAIRTFINK